MQNGPNKTKATKQDIHVIVVESHNHVLAHIHQALRKQKLLGQSWRMVHFDSHADLACPGPHVPAYCCFRPSHEVAVRLDRTNVTCHTDHDDEETGTASVAAAADENNNENEEAAELLDLYDLLNSTTSGIAEWILPLVLAADLAYIHWARPKRTTAYLIPSGSHCYRVGAWWKKESGRTAGGAATTAKDIASFTDLPAEAVVKVDSPLLYYMEDQSTVPADELALFQMVNLHVSEGDEELRTTTSTTTTTRTQSLPYILDICLDYFCCVNPFMSDLELISPRFASAFQRAIAATKLAQPTGGQVDEDLRSGQEGLQHSLAFQKALATVLENPTGGKVHSPDALAKMFGMFYETGEIGAELVGSLIGTLADCKDTQTLSTLAIEAIPYAMMPHDECVFDRRDENTCIVAYPWIEERLQTFRTIVERQSQLPLLVTVARSLADGFTPSSTVVDEIQHKVLSLLEDAYSMFVMPDCQAESGRVLVRCDYS